MSARPTTQKNAKAKEKSMNWKNVTVRLGYLKPWADNPRMSTKKQAERILASFKKFGQVYPIAIGPNMEVYDGHSRLSALLTVHGEDHQVEARQLERLLTAKERREFVILLNGTATGMFDWDALANWDAQELIGFGMDQDFLKEWKSQVGALGVMLESENIQEIDAPELKDGDRTPFRQVTFTLHDEQWEEVQKAVSRAKEQGGAESAVNENTNGNALAFTAQRFNRGRC